MSKISQGNQSTTQGDGFDMVNPDKAIQILNKILSKEIESYEPDDEGRGTPITRQLFEVMDDHDVLEEALEDYKTVAKLLNKIEKTVMNQLKMNRKILELGKLEDNDMQLIEAQISAMGLIEYLLESEL